ncbi:MAG TPA: hypothetical protein VES39_10860, partial [Rhodospirillales bacterium]|nr:hypothetical protein [Rhodospirillales bacterium]
DRDLSNAQLSGMDHGWFINELIERTRWCDFPPLVATATDGDNGGWFRNVNPLANFWNFFYQKALDEVRAGTSPLRPTFIDAYLDRFGAHGRVRVRRGAWNTDTHHGWDFHQWQGSQPQRDALARIYDLSAGYHKLARRAPQRDNGELARVLEEAHWHLLRAETSCNLYWGEAWVWKTHKDLDDVAWHLGEAGAILGPEPPAPPVATAAASIEPPRPAEPEVSAAKTTATKVRPPLRDAAPRS